MVGRWVRLSGLRFQEFHDDVFCLGFSQREVVTTEFDFQRVAERGGPDKRHGSSRNQPHFPEADKRRPARREAADGSGRADGEFGKFHRRGLAVVSADRVARR